MSDLKPSPAAFTCCSVDEPSLGCACSLRIFDLPAEAYSGELKSQSATELHDDTTDSFAAALQVQEGELVYDYAWYSCMHTSDPVSCCFVTTSRVSHCCAYSISTNAAGHSLI